jgi:hypothetical protein
VESCVLEDDDDGAGAGAFPDNAPRINLHCAPSYIGDLQREIHLSILGPSRSANTAECDLYSRPHHDFGRRLNSQGGRDAITGGSVADNTNTQSTHRGFRYVLIRDSRY